MTIPTERTRAVLQTRDFLTALLFSNDTPRVPRYVRSRALRCLRHYPFSSGIWRAAERSPDIFAPPRKA
jgi:hypothetical protein